MSQAKDDGSSLRTSESHLASSRDQLNLVLNFFARVDTKLSVVLGIDLGMAGLLASKTPTDAEVWAGAWVIVGVFVTLLAISLFHLYRGSFPNVDGGHGSLVYFREIARRSETEYRDAFRCLSTSELADDLIRQTWRNSVILKDKFKHLRWSYIFMALAIVPWLFAVGLFVAA
jgi:hypothetical protein